VFKKNVNKNFVVLENFRIFALECGKILSGGACMTLLVNNITALAVIRRV